MQTFLANKKRQFCPPENSSLPDAVAVGATKKTTHPKPVVPGHDPVEHFFASSHKYGATRDKIEQFHAAAAKTTGTVFAARPPPILITELRHNEPVLKLSSHPISKINPPKPPSPPHYNPPIEILGKNQHFEPFLGLPPLQPIVSKTQAQALRAAVRDEANRVSFLTTHDEQHAFLDLDPAFHHPVVMFISVYFHVLYYCVYMFLLPCNYPVFCNVYYLLLHTHN